MFRPLGPRFPPGSGSTSASTERLERGPLDEDRDPLRRGVPPRSAAASSFPTPWSRSAVRDILSNPKYTGFMVWNRRATKKGGTAQLARDLGLVRPTDTRADRDAGDVRRRCIRWQDGGAIARRTSGQRAPSGFETELRPPLLRRMRSLRPPDAREDPPADGVLRMRARPQPGPWWRDPLCGSSWKPWVLEDALLDGVLNFFAEGIFGVDRQRLLEDELARGVRSDQADVARQANALQRQGR